MIDQPTKNAATCGRASGSRAYVYMAGRMSGAIIAAESSDTPNRIRVHQLTDKLSMLQDELDNEKQVQIIKLITPHPQLKHPRWIVFMGRIIASNQPALD